MEANPLGIYQPTKSQAPPARAASDATIALPLSGIGGGRVTVDTEQGLFQSALSVLAPISSDEYWRDYGLDSRTLSRVPMSKLVELMADLSPDVSRALWDFLRFCNPGWKVTVYQPKGEAVNTKGQELTDTFLKSLHGPYVVTNQVPADTVIGTLFLTAFLRGALVSELVLDADGKMPLEIATPDPQSVRFKKMTDPVRGAVWQPGQYQDGKFVPFDRESIAYVPIDPLPGSPSGRPMVTPALFCAIFLIGLLHDLRRVVAQQGYPRIDLEINVDELKKLMPAGIQGDAVKMKAWFAAAFSEIKAAYALLEPDDAYVHFNAVTVNKPVGTVDASSLGGIDGLIRGLERMSVRALKTMPLMFGLVEGGNEANANRQWEIHVAGVKSIQHLAETMLEKLLTLGLRAQGVAARVEFRFAELRAAELLRDAQVERYRIQNARMAYDNGLINQDEQAQMAIGKVKADAPEPRAKASTAGVMSGTGSGNTVDPGSNRGKRSVESQTLLFTAGNPPTDDEQDEAVSWWRTNAPGEAGDLIEPEVVN